MIKQDLDITNIGSFIYDNDDQIFRFLEYKKIFTPYEIENKFMDATIYEDDHYGFAYITNVIEIPNDVLLELDLISIEDDEIFSFHRKLYKKLSDIKLYKFERDNETKYRWVNDELDD